MTNDIGSRLRNELKALLGSEQFQSIRDTDKMADVLMKRRKKIFETFDEKISEIKEQLRKEEEKKAKKAEEDKKK